MLHFPLVNRPVVILTKCHHLSSNKIYLHEMKSARFHLKSALHQRYLCFVYFKLAKASYWCNEHKKVYILSKFFHLKQIHIKVRYGRISPQIPTAYGKSIQCKWTGQDERVP